MARLTGWPGRSGLMARLGLLVVFVAVLWAVQAVNWASGYALNRALGLVPRQLDGLRGILAMPLLHGGFGHLAANTPPLLVMGALLASTAGRAIWSATALIVLLGGGLVWLLGAPAIHIGASGLIFGWFGYLVTRGLWDRAPLALGVALAVALFYGSMIWGVLPGQPGVSWESHLFGALAGAIAAFVLRAGVRAGVRAPSGRRR